MRLSKFSHSFITRQLSIPFSTYSLTSYKDVKLDVIYNPFIETLEFLKNCELFGLVVLLRSKYDVGYTYTRTLNEVYKKFYVPKTSHKWKKVLNTCARINCFSNRKLSSNIHCVLHFDEFSKQELLNDKDLQNKISSLLLVYYKAIYKNIINQSIKTPIFLNSRQQICIKQYHKYYDLVSKK